MQPGLVLLGSLLLRHQILFLLGTPNNKQTAWEGRRKELWDHPWSNRLSEQTYSQFSDGLNSTCQIQSSTQISKTHTRLDTMQMVYWCYVSRWLTGDLLNLMDHHKGIRQSNLHWMIDRVDLCDLQWDLKWKHILVHSSSSTWGGEVRRLVWKKERERAKKEDKKSRKKERERKKTWREGEA